MAALRRNLAPSPQPLIACFCRLDRFTRDHLLPLLAELLRRDSARRLLLLGGDGPRLGAEIVARVPASHPRIHAPGYLPREELACHLAASDLLIQAYADGISTRRGTAMAGLALGCCLLTHAGHNTETVWRDSSAVALAPLPSLLPVAEALLANPERRREFAAAGRALYLERFDLARTLCTLRQAALP